MRPLTSFLGALIAVAHGVHAQSQPTTVRLVKADAAARGGVVRIRSTDRGLIVEGDVDGPAPRWPSSIAELARAEHIDIWIADTAPARLPPVGWGNQFDYSFLTRDADCSIAPRDTSARAARDCVTWFRRETNARPAIGRLFVRRWSIAPTMASETFAHPAFASLEPNIASALKLLEPAASVSPAFVPAKQGGGYHFEVAIPWDALPPLRTTRLDALRVLVDVYSQTTAGTLVRSTTGAAAMSGDATTFPVVPLSHARRSAPPCGATFERPMIQNGVAVDYLDPSDSSVVYYRPADSLALRRAIVLDVPAHGYQYEPEPSSSALVASTMSFWSLPLGDGEMLCGPHLAYAHGKDTTRSELVVDLPDSVAARRLSPNEILIKAGPRTFSTYYGSGQCGACARVSLQLFHVDRASGALTPAFSYRGIAEFDVSDIDVELSPDWREVTVFEGRLDPSDDSTRTTWHATTHCYRPATRTYELCRDRDDIAPPAKRRVVPVSPIH